MGKDTEEENGKFTAKSESAGLGITRWYFLHLNQRGRGGEEEERETIRTELLSQRRTPLLPDSTEEVEIA